MRTALALTIFAVALVLAAAASAETLKLRNKVNATSDVVVMSDFFEGDVEAGTTALFRAPRPGQYGLVHVSRLAAAVARLGYRWTPPKGLNRIRVTRDIAVIEVDEIAALIRREIAGALPDLEDPDNLDVTLPAGLGAVRIADSRDPGLVVNRLDLAPGSRRFSARMVFGEGNGQVRRTIEGRYSVRRRVPVPNRTIEREDILTSDDIQWIRLDESAIGNTLTQTEDIIGKAARRTLPEGQPIRAADIEPPRVVTRNQLVTLVYRVPGMTLTARGRALRDAAVGESVSILNLSSNRTVEATATGPGQVSVTDTVPDVRLASSQ